MIPSAICINAGANSITTEPIGSLSELSDDGDGFVTTAIPPIIIKIPAMIIIIPNPLDGCFNEMKNAIIGKISAGPPNPIPRCMSFNGKNPSLASLPIHTETSAP